jgi:MFS family permease
VPAPQAVRPGGTAGAQVGSRLLRVLSARIDRPHVPLRRNRDFQLLWLGQVVSDLGGRISGVAFPLLVLELTDSPAKAGLTAFAGSLPLVLFFLPAGAVADRVDRKRVMLASDAARCLALGSIPAAYALDRLTFGQILLVAAIEATGFAFFSVSERAALRQVVPTAQLPDAIAQNQAREYTALLAGPPIGGALFGIGRMLPFAVDAISYLLSFVSLLFIRTRLQLQRAREKRRLRAEIAEGARWLWRHPFLRTTALLVAGSDLTLNALFLVVIVLAEEQGASSALIGWTVAFIGVGGLVGAGLAPLLSRRLRPTFVVRATMWAVALLIPLLLVAPHPIVLGVLYGAMFTLHPTWGAVVGAYRVALVPDDLQGRVQSVASSLSVAAVPFGFLAVGILLETIGSTATTLALFGVMLIVAVAAATSASVRAAPSLRDLDGTATS